MRGDTYNLECRYRDSLSGGARFNFSDATSVILCYIDEMGVRSFSLARALANRQTRWPARARHVSLALAVSLSTGCVTDDQWSFSFSRALYFNEDAFPRISERLADPGVIIETPQAALILLGLPLAIDLALLPVTLPRDVYDWSR